MYFFFFHLIQKHLIIHLIIHEYFLPSFQERTLLSQFRHDNIVQYLGTDKVCCFLAGKSVIIYVLGMFSVFYPNMHSYFRFNSLSLLS